VSIDTSTSELYDPNRPWISHEGEDVQKANWLAEFFWPEGRSTKPVFLRGQMYLAIVRAFVFIGAIIATGSNPWVGAAIAFFGLGLLLAMSMISHLRRLTDAAKPVLLAMIISLPFLLGTSLAVLGAASVPAQMALIEAEAAQQAEQAAAPMSTDGAEVTEDASVPPQTAQRRGPEGPVTEQGLLAQAIASGLNIWFLLSIFSALFTFFYVARRPTKEASNAARGIYG
tara:strand:- start:15774 stop:16457 length:684 start_codon:yes stop_codon:yes gene_type:complete